MEWHKLYADVLMTVGFTDNMKCTYNIIYVCFGQLYTPCSDYCTTELVELDQCPPPCNCDCTLTPVGERRAALFGGDIFGPGAYSDDLLIAELTKHTVVSV